MAINPSLLVSAAVLQLYFVDKDTGIPLSNGKITFYQDNARTFLKNVYYQTGVPGNYVYLPAPNPMFLSAVGTPQDDNGNDILLFYYPFDENDSNVQQLYFVTAFNSNAAPQWTRSGFPFEALNSPSNTGNPTLDNIIVNNVFWRNVGSVNISGINTILAPGAHEGFITTDIRYIKDVNDGTDVITFNKFTSTLASKLVTGNETVVTPEYYLNFNSTVAGSSTFKVVQFPINAHIDTLTANTQYTAAIWVQNVAGNPNNILQVYLFQYLGTGIVSTAPILITPQITASNTWTRYILKTGVFPTGYGTAVSSTGDDGYYLQIAFQTGVATNINFTQPELYLGNTVANNSFQSYDEINSIVSSPRTGDIRTSVNSFSPFGWVPLNDGSIGNVGSGATTRANIDTWLLFQTLYLNVSDTYAPVSGGRTAPGNTITAAYTDWNLNKNISLTKTLGRSLASVGLASSGSATTWTLGQTGGADTHTLLQAELPNVNLSSNLHSISTDGGTGGSVGAGNADNALGTFQIITPLGGSATPFNIVDPVIHYNVFMKL